jgi:hypothetical protein
MFFILASIKDAEAWGEKKNVKAWAFQQIQETCPDGSFWV